MYIYNKVSNGGVALANKLGIRRIRHDNSKFEGNKDKSVINWGASKVSIEVAKCKVFNCAKAARNASDKIDCFRILGEYGVFIPTYFLDKNKAVAYFEDDNIKEPQIVCRTLTRASVGRGIVMAKTVDELVDAPLYTVYIKKTEEYRIHVVQGKVIDMQRKARNKDVADEDVNWQIRTHGNGFIYMREDVYPPQEVLTQAVNAVEALGLDFGAVDIVWNIYQNKPYVLEVNTAPGLEGTTLDRYVVAFKAMLEAGPGNALVCENDLPDGEDNYVAEYGYEFELEEDDEDE